MSSRHSAASLRTSAAGSKSKPRKVGPPTTSTVSAPSSSFSSSSIVAAAIRRHRLRRIRAGLDTTNGKVRPPSDADLDFTSNNGNGAREQRTSVASLLLAASSTSTGARVSALTNEADGDEFEEDSKIAAAGDGYNTRTDFGGSSYNRTESSTTLLATTASARDGSGGSVLEVKSECCRSLLLGIESLGVLAAANDADGRDDIDVPNNEDIAADEDNDRSEEDQRELGEIFDRRAKGKEATRKPLAGRPTTPKEITYYAYACIYGHPWAVEFYFKYFVYDPLIQKHLEDIEATRGAPLSSRDLALEASLYMYDALDRSLLAASSATNEAGRDEEDGVGFEDSGGYNAESSTNLLANTDINDEDIVADYDAESSTNGGSVLAAASGRGNVADADDDGRDDISESLEALKSVVRNGGIHGLPEEQQRKFVVYFMGRVAATGEPLGGLPTTPKEIVYFREACMYDHSWALEMYEKYLAGNPVIQNHLEEYEARETGAVSFLISSSTAPVPALLPV